MAGGLERAVDGHALKVSGKMSVWVKDICPVPIEFSTEDRSLVKKA